MRDREKAQNFNDTAAWAERQRSQIPDALAWRNAHYEELKDNETMNVAFNALTYGLKLACQAAPDFLYQIDIDACARMILAAYPPKPQGY
jgi:hypothetical protein